MSNTPSDTKTENLGFTIENRAGIDVLVWKEGGCRPATSAEIAMWKALSAVQQPVAREQLTYEQIQDLLLCGDPTDEEMRLIRIGWDAAHGIKGGQHGTE